MRIISLIHTTEPRTGGQRYNVHLEDCLATQTEVVRICEPYERYAWYQKPLAPLMELRLLMDIKEDDVLLLGDTTYKYHLLLQWWCRHIIHCQTMVMVHHFAYLEKEGLKQWLMEKITDCYLRDANKILVPSVYTLELARKKFANKAVYLPLPFTTSYQESKTHTPGQLLFVGNIEHRKGLHYFPMIMEQLPKYVRLNIVGAVQNKAYYHHLQKAFAKAHVEGQVVWHGALNKEELEKLYKNAEVFVFPSLLEGFGIVLIEAMSYGLPIVAFNNTAMPYTIVHEKNGLLANNTDTKQMAKMIQSILNNSDKRSRLQRGMNETISHLCSEEDLCQAVALLVKTLKQKT